MLLLIKFLGAPLLIGGASLAGKRFGPNVAGMLSGLPVIAGPIVLVLWLERGPTYAADVARMLPVGLVALAAYIWMFAKLAPRCHWVICLFAGWLAFLLLAALCSFAWLPYWVMIVLGVGLMWLLGQRLPKPAATPLAAMPKSELLVRMFAALALVALVTTISAQIGTAWTGLLAAFPVAGSVLPAFTLANSGPAATMLLLRGFVSGLLGLAGCFLLIAWLLPVWGGWAFVAGFVLAAVIARTLGRIQSN